MRNERELERLKKEPIRVKLGEEFRPFGNIESLDGLEKGETPDVRFISDSFYLEGIGRGKVVVSELEDAQKFKLLDISEGTVQVI